MEHRWETYVFMPKEREFMFSNRTTTEINGSEKQRFYQCYKADKYKFAEWSTVKPDIEINRKVHICEHVMYEYVPVKNETLVKVPFYIPEKYDSVYVRWKSQ